MKKIWIVDNGDVYESEIFGRFDNQVAAETAAGILRILEWPDSDECFLSGKLHSRVEVREATVFDDLDDWWEWYEKEEEWFFQERRMFEERQK